MRKFISLTCLSLATTLPAFAGPVTLNGGLWEGQLTVATDVFLDERLLSDCLHGETVALSTADLLARIEPEGQCTVLSEEETEEGIQLAIECTGGTISEGDVLIASTPDDLEIMADVIFGLGEDLFVPGVVLAISHNAGACPAE
ncbi:hypothetical protein ACQKH5_07945 [Hyphomonas sp. NPDC076900]|uniref:hypothetical protein n=1 Tax=unclassified Hyphomonas TaxID=2630699 RepID=UPI003D03E13B